MELDIVLECDRAGKPYAFRDNKPASSVLNEDIDRLCECIGIQCDTVTHAAIVCHAYLARRNLRTMNLLHIERKIPVEVSELIV